MAHCGMAVAGEMDDDSLPDDAAATDAVRGSRLVPAEVFSVRGPGSAWLSEGASYTGDVVGS
jgi:hypothetical protein